MSRRLGLLDELAAAVQAAVRAGVVPPQAAMKYLVPLARANRGQCEQLLAGLGTTAVSVRELGALYQAWRRADAAGRQRLVADPLLFLRALAAATTDRADDDADAPLLKDFIALNGIAWRARPRVHQGDALTAEQTHAWRAARDAFASLTAAIEENHAGRIDPDEHPGPA